jgi:hypothetical protein
MDTTMNRTARSGEGKGGRRRDGAPRAGESRHNSVFHDAARLVRDIETLIVDVEKLAERIVDAANSEISQLRRMAPAAAIAMFAGGCAALWFATRRSRMRARSRRQESDALTRWEGEGGAAGHQGQR